MEFIVENIHDFVLVFINLAFILGAYFRLKAKVESIDTKVIDIEKTRYRNVEALREIYDAKVMDSKKYAKGLFEVRDSEIKELSNRMSSLEIKFDKQTELINDKFNQLIKTTAFIEATLKARK